VKPESEERRVEKYLLKRCLKVEFISLLNIETKNYAGGLGDATVSLRQSEIVV
jgi:hypothetical protein